MYSFDNNIIINKKEGKKVVKDYDPILQRLITIITKLSNDERYTTAEFAKEFNVSVKTIQNDIYKRLSSSFPITKDNLGRFKFEDGFSLDKSILDNREMILVSLSLSCLKDNSDVFNKTSQSILQKLLYPNFFNPYYIKKEQFESIDMNSPIIKEIETAIKDKIIINIGCINNIKTVEPYKIASFDNFWYLFAKDLKDNKIKTFMLSNIKHIELTKQKYKTNQKTIDSVLENIHSAWFDDGQTFEVVIEVLPPITQYFLKRDFLQSQEILKKKSNGNLIIKFEVTHDEDIDNLIKSWLPHIKVLEPTRFKNKIKKELQRYLQEY
jgi:predicted DNA-binding transcriptional regulator YafY